jgi:hypothetical protein
LPDFSQGYHCVKVKSYYRSKEGRGNLPLLTDTPLQIHYY